MVRLPEAITQSEVEKPTVAKAVPVLQMELEQALSDQIVPKLHKQLCSILLDMAFPITRVSTKTI